MLDVFPSDLGEVIGVTSGTNCTEDTKPDIAPPENLIIDIVEYVEYSDGLPDHLISISGLINGLGNQPKPFLATVKANLYIESFAEGFAYALGLEDHTSKLDDHEVHWRNGPEDVVVAALHSPITISIEKDPYFRMQSSEEDCNDSN